MPNNQQPINKSKHNQELQALTAKTSVSGKLSAGSRQLHQQYQRAQIETASPTHLIILLYDGAIKFCSRAIEGMQKKDIELQHNNLVKVQKIVAELMGSLDKEAGGEIADNLFRLYAHMLQELVAANLYDKIEQVENVKHMLEELRETWQQIDQPKLYSKPEPEKQLIRTAAAVISSVVTKNKMVAHKPIVPSISRLGEQNA